MNELPYQVRKWRDPLRWGDLKEMSAPRVWYMWEHGSPGLREHRTEHGTCYIVELHGKMLGVVRVCRGLMMMSPVR